MGKSVIRQTKHVPPEGGVSPCDAPSPHGCGACELNKWREQYEKLKERMLEVGFMAIDMLDEKQKYRLVVMQYLRDAYGDLKVSTESLHSLKRDVKREAMDYLYAVLQGNPRRKDIVNEVFRIPRKRRQDCFNEYGEEIP